MARGIDSARLDAELLLSHGLKCSRMDIYMNYDYPLNEEEIQTCRELIVRRGKGEPVAYITGQKGFFRHSFNVNPEVLIPRPDTELLVEEAIKWLEEKKVTTGEIWDLGSGSGCVGLSIIKEKKNLKLQGFDFSSEAINVARTNAEMLGVENRVRWRCCDLSEDFGGEGWAKFGTPEIIVTNPPYIDRNDNELSAGVRDFEPSAALFSSEEGFFHLKQWGDRALEVLPRGGLLLMEFGHRQGKVLLEHFNHLACVETVEILKDLAFKDRVLKVRVK